MHLMYSTLIIEESYVIVRVPTHRDIQICVKYENIVDLDMSYLHAG